MSVFHETITERGSSEFKITPIIFFSEFVSKLEGMLLS